MNDFRTLLLPAAALLLSACGGGDQASGQSTLDDATARAVAQFAVTSQGQLDNQAEGAFGDLYGAGQAPAGKPQGRRQAAMLPLQCLNAGGRQVQIIGTPGTGIDAGEGITVSFSDCVIFEFAGDGQNPPASIVLNGSKSVLATAASGNVGAPTGPWSATADIDINQLTTTLTAGQESLSLALDADLTATAGRDDQGTASLLASGSFTMSLGGIDVGLSSIEVIKSVTSAGRASLEVDYALSVEGEGVFAVDTLQAVVDEDGDGRPDSGLVEISGSNGSLRIELFGNGMLTLTVDRDGDGSFESTVGGVSDWEQLQAATPAEG